MASRSQSQTVNHLLVILAALALFATPVILVAHLLLPLQEQAQQNGSGLIRYQPGQAVLLRTDVEALREDTRAIVAVEKLNSGVLLLALRDPLQANLMSAQSEAEVAQKLRELDPEMEGHLEKAYYGRARWVGGCPPWGMYLLPDDDKPSTGIPFGVVHFEHGMEKTQMDTEITINRLNAHLKSPAIIKILQAAIATGSIDEKTAVKTLAATQILGITFHDDSQLFLSPQSQVKWNQLQADLRK